MTLMITGSEGFIGRALVKRCQAQGIDYVPFDLEMGDDIRNPHAVSSGMPEGAVIVHLAGLSSNKQCNADPTLAESVNVDGTANVVRAAHERHAKQLILASSEWVYEGLDGLLTEDRSLAFSGHGVYASTKICAEAECLKLQPYRATILRFGIVYGPRKEAGSAVESIFRQARDAECVVVGSALTARRFIHVEDIVSGVLASVGRDGFEVYNLTGDELISLSDVQRVCERDLGRPFSTMYAADASNPSIRDAPNTLARKALNWKPEYDLERGLRTLAESVDA